MKQAKNVKRSKNLSMNYKLIPTDLFKREVKRLAKHYPSLKNDLTDLYENLEKNPLSGTDLGNP